MEENEAPRFTFALKRGSVLAGRYRIERLLADSSSFALTYLATDTSFTDDAPVRVAIKEFLPRVLVGRGRDGTVVQPHSPADAKEFARALRRFRHEGEVLSDIESPNLVRVHRCLEENGTGYLVMDQRQGRPLSIAFADAAGGSMPSADAVSIVFRLLEVLEQIHAEGVLHRGVSPDTVLMTDTWEPVLHGFSARRHVHGEAAEIVPGFAAFELYGSGDVGPWTDVYACAALLYYLITGTTPPAAIDRAAGKALTPASWLASDVSNELSQVIARGLSLLPEQRPHGAVEFRKEIERAEAEANAASAEYAPFEVEASEVTPPSIDDDFGPEGIDMEPVSEAPSPSLAIDRPRVAGLLGRIAGGVRDGLRPTSAILRISKRALESRVDDTTSPTLISESGTALMHRPIGNVVRRSAAAVAVVALAGSGAFWMLGQRRNTDIQGQLSAAETRNGAVSSRRGGLVDPNRSGTHTDNASGAVQQAVPSTTANSTTARPTSPLEHRAEEKSAPEPVVSLPTLKKINVPAAIDAEKELVPVDVVLDLRTQLTNGQAQADEGQYALARRILATAKAGADAAINKFSKSATLRSIRSELDSADRRALAACQAENEVIRKRRGTPVPCE